MALWVQERFHHPEPYAAEDMLTLLLRCSGFDRKKWDDRKFCNVLATECR